MENLYSRIPKPPSIPKPPKAPARPKLPTPPTPLNLEDAPGGGGGSAPQMPSFGAAGAGEMPGHIAEIIGAIMQKTGSNHSGHTHVKKMISGFNLDKFRDENGNLQPPMTKEERMKYVRYYKSLT